MLNFREEFNKRREKKEIEKKSEIVIRKEGEPFFKELLDALENHKNFLEITNIVFLINEAGKVITVQNSWDNDIIYSRKFKNVTECRIIFEYIKEKIILEGISFSEGSDYLSIFLD